MDIRGLRVLSGVQRDHWESTLETFEDRYEDGLYKQLTEVAKAIIANTFKKNFIFLTGAPGSGKCLGKGTKVVMLDGRLKKVEDIRNRDLLMGPDSKPRMVLGTNKGFGDLYKIVQNRGISYIVNGDHVLSLKERHGKHRAVNITVKDFLRLSDYKKRELLGHRSGVALPEKPVKIDPYYLGLWLGDGDKDRLSITNVDMEVVEYIYRYARRIRHKVSFRKYGSRVGSYLIHQGNPGRRAGALRGYHGRFIKEGSKPNKGASACWLWKWFDECRLFNNKHIPDEYIYNSKRVRMAVLAGIIDTDGYMHKKTYEITQKSEQLTQQIKYLCNSLGLRCVVTKTVKTIKGIGFSGEYYRMSISGELQDVPVRIARKRIRSFTGNKNPAVMGIVVEPIGIGEYYGFELSADGLFLLEDFTVTHNSHFLVGLFRAKVLADEGVMGTEHALYMPFANMITEIIEGLQETHSTRMGLAKYLPVRYLFIDDISRGERVINPEKIEGQVFREVLLNRFEDRKYVVCTSNYTPVELRRMIKAVFGSYVLSRVESSSMFIEFPNKDFRKKDK